MFKFFTPFLLALLPLFAPTAWAQDDDDDDDYAPEVYADFQEGDLFYHIKDDAVEVSTQYYQEDPSMPAYDEEKTPKGRIVVPQTVTHEGKTYTVVGIHSAAFNACTEVTEVVLPSTIKSIGNEAFQGTMISSIVLPEGVTNVGNSAFQNTKLTSIDLPKGLMNLGDYAFAECSELTSFTLPKEIHIVPNSLLQNCRKLTTLQLHSEVMQINDFAFDNCRELKSFTFPKALIKIGQQVLNNCDALTDVYCEFSDPAQLTNLNPYRSIFHGTPKDKMKLHVPAGAKANFEETEPWKSKFVAFLEDATTGVASLQASAQVQSTAQGLTLGLTLPQSLRIYTLQGALLRQGTLAAGQHHIGLPSGVYLVKLGQQSAKVAVR